jgi:hypothetical protein
VTTQTTQPAEPDRANRGEPCADCTHRNSMPQLVSSQGAAWCNHGEMCGMWRRKKT